MTRFLFIIVLYWFVCSFWAAQKWNVQRFRKKKLIQLRKMDWRGEEKKQGDQLGDFWKMWFKPVQLEKEGKAAENYRGWGRILHAALVCMTDIYRRCVLSVIISSAVLSFAIWRWPLWWWLLCCVQLWLKKVTWESRIYHMSQKAALWGRVCKAYSDFHLISSLSFQSPPPSCCFLCPVSLSPWMRESQKVRAPVDGLLNGEWQSYWQTWD